MNLNDVVVAAVMRYRVRIYVKLWLKNIMYTYMRNIKNGRILTSNWET